jgi:hypothetical protein
MSGGGVASARSAVRVRHARTGSRRHFVSSRAVWRRRRSASRRSKRRPPFVPTASSLAASVFTSLTLAPECSFGIFVRSPVAMFISSTGVMPPKTRTRYIDGGRLNCAALPRDARSPQSAQLSRHRSASHSSYATERQLANVGCTRRLALPCCTIDLDRDTKSVADCCIEPG